MDLVLLNRLCVFDTILTGEMLQALHEVLRTAHK